MKRLINLIYKDFLLLIRDKAGLVFLFVMPLVLVLVMTGMQEGALESATKNSISLIVLDSDKDEIGLTVEKELQEKDMFDVKIPASEIVPENFNSVRAMSDLVERISEEF